MLPRKISHSISYTQSSRERVCFVTRPLHTEKQLLIEYLLRKRIHFVQSLMRGRRAHCLSQRQLPLSASLTIHSVTNAAYSAVYAYSVACRAEGIMDNNQIPNTSEVASAGGVVADEASTLRNENAVLREDNEDLRASALWWKTLYEETLRRITEVENSPKARVSSRGEIRFPTRSQAASGAPRAGASTTTRSPVARLRAAVSARQRDTDQSR